MRMQKKLKGSKNNNTNKPQNQEVLMMKKIKHTEHGYTQTQKKAEKCILTGIR